MPFYLYLENRYTELRDDAQKGPKVDKRKPKGGGDLKKEGKEKETIVCALKVTRCRQEQQRSTSQTLSLVSLPALSQIRTREGCRLLLIRLRTFHRNSSTKSRVPKY